MMSAGKDAKARDEAADTAELLRLVKAFQTVEDRQLREAVIVLVEHLGASKPVMRGPPKFDS